jgi:hypothetical protein
MLLQLLFLTLAAAQQVTQQPNRTEIKRLYNDGGGCNEVGNITLCGDGTSWNSTMERCISVTGVVEQCPNGKIYSPSFNFQPCSADTIITSAADCIAAAAFISAPYGNTAGPEWQSGCLFHGGNVYYSAHVDDSDQNPTDAYICHGSFLECDN